VPLADQAPWTNSHERRRHFHKHRQQFPHLTEDGYDASARATIRTGKRFTYEDSGQRKRRVGYYDPYTQRFTALNEAETNVLTHYRCLERYVRNLPASDYRR